MVIQHIYQCISVVWAWVPLSFFICVFIVTVPALFILLKHLLDIYHCNYMLCFRLRSTWLTPVIYWYYFRSLDWTGTVEHFLPSNNYVNETRHGKNVHWMLCFIVDYSCIDANFQSAKTHLENIKTSQSDILLKPLHKIDWDDVLRQLVFEENRCPLSG